MMYVCTHGDIHRTRKIHATSRVNMDASSCSLDWSYKLLIIRDVSPVRDKHYWLNIMTHWTDRGQRHSQSQLCIIYTCEHLSCLDVYPCKCTMTYRQQLKHAATATARAQIRIQAQDLKSQWWAVLMRRQGTSWGHLDLSLVMWHLQTHVYKWIIIHSFTYIWMYIHI